MTVKLASATSSRPPTSMERPRAWSTAPGYGAPHGGPARGFDIDIDIGSVGAGAGAAAGSPDRNGVRARGGHRLRHRRQSVRPSGVPCLPVPGADRVVVPGMVIVSMAPALYRSQV
jgi:hypothetical protein